MTVNDLALVLMREQDEATDDANFVTVVETWIQDALDEFSSAAEWRLFRNTVVLPTVASQSTYALSANVREIRSIRFQDTNETIEYVDSPRLFSIAEDLENLGKPQFWFWKSSTVAADPIYNIQLVPIPDGIYSLELLAVFHPTLSPLTSALIPLQQEMILALKYRVRAYLLARDKDYDGSNSNLQLFYGKVDQMMQRENAPKANNIRMQVRDISNSSDRRLARLDPDHFS